MERSLLDTDTFSEILKGRNATVKERYEAYLSVFGRLTLSVVTVMEQVEGFHRQEMESQIQSLLLKLEQEGHELLPLDYEAAKIGGRVFADLHRTGQPIGRADPLIAAIALRHDLLLVTGNTSHFQRLQSLGYNIRLDNWRD